jgi:hypothetical protein
MQLTVVRIIISKISGMLIASEPLDSTIHGPLASQGWMVHPADGRVVAFAGHYLHGASRIAARRVVLWQCSAN